MRMGIRGWWRMTRAVGRTGKDTARETEKEETGRDRNAFVERERERERKRWRGRVEWQGGRESEMKVGDERETTGRDGAGLRGKRVEGGMGWTMSF